MIKKRQQNQPQIKKLDKKYVSPGSIPFPFKNCFFLISLQHPASIFRCSRSEFYWVKTETKNVKWEIIWRYKLWWQKVEKKIIDWKGNKINSRQRHFLVFFINHSKKNPHVNTIEMNHHRLISFFRIKYQ